MSDARPPFRVVREWREAKGLTQAQAAERFRVSTRTWQRYEAAGSRPPRWLLAVLARLRQRR